MPEVTAAVRRLLVAGVVLLPLVGVAIGQTGGPAARLSRVDPDLFPVESLADAAVGGDQGARIVAITPAQREFGLQEGDVVLATFGPIRGDAAEYELLVWRTVPGERPVLAPAVLGRRVLDEFAALPDSEWAPMRLAVMLANQQTLVDQGGGILLLPASEGFDADLWLARANPLPRVSETAIAQVAQATSKRTSIPLAPDGELRAAQEHYEAGEFLEAAERARRAMVESVLLPKDRADRTRLVEATRIYEGALRRQREHRALLLEPEPNFAVVLEGQINRIQAFLPQNTQIEADASTGGVFLAGVRLRAPVDDVPVLSDLFLLVEYGVVKNRFVDPQNGSEVLSTTLQQVAFELLYRPRVASRLKPFVRGGVGIFPFTARVPCSSENAIDELEYGALFGGGLDFLQVPALHLRASVAGSYRIVHSKFLPEEAPLLEPCRNTDVPLDRDFYEFDMDGWQVGLMLTFEL